MKQELRNQRSESKDFKRNTDPALAFLVTAGRSYKCLHLQDVIGLKSKRHYSSFGTLTTRVPGRKSPLDFRCENAAGHPGGQQPALIVFRHFVIPVVCADGA